MKPARLLDLRAVSDETGLPYGTLYKLVKNGTLPSVSVPGLRRLLIDRSDLERAIQRWKAEAR